MKKRRDTTIDIMKGILILLMVLAHAQGPGHRWIYLFHMAAFFMISGYLFGDRYEINIMQFIKRKIVSLYIPYVVCNILYLAWFLCAPIFFERAMCEKSVSGVLYEIIKIFLFRGRSSMSGATWFLAVLFIVSILYAFVRIVIGKMVQSDMNRYILVTLSAIASLAAGYIFYVLDINLFQVGTICSSYGAFHLGNIVRKTAINNKIEQNKYFHTCIAILAGVGTLILLRVSGNEIKLITNTIVNPVYYSLGMIFGWFIVRYIAIFLDKYHFSRNTFSYLGRHSLIILCAHFAAFRIVAAIQCVYFNLPMSNVSSFPVVKVEGFWWFAYLAIGIGIPLLFRYLFTAIKERILK